MRAVGLMWRPRDADPVNGGESSHLSVICRKSRASTGSDTSSHKLVLNIHSPRATHRNPEILRRGQQRTITDGVQQHKKCIAGEPTIRTCARHWEKWENDCHPS
ncbi:hypothetical protein RB195_005251 [Necator americanus]|uniref:Uncharacterized protein n=1 Tax=Necator americanus TaxID=51031 RepID=A0ABR1BPX3_NECAM